MTDRVSAIKSDLAKAIEQLKRANADNEKLEIAINKMRRELEDAESRLAHKNIEDGTALGKVIADLKSANLALGVALEKFDSMQPSWVREAKAALSLPQSQAERVHAALMECYEAALRYKKAPLGSTVCQQPKGGIKRADPALVEWEAAYRGLFKAVESVERELGKEG